jgi:endonuclease/exonuclease/phosphatase family metal-dependent hydrolase
MVWPLLGLILGFFFIKISFRIPIINKYNSNTEYLSVMSLNADFFQRGILSRNDLSENLINWTLEDSSSIKCIQEFQSKENDQNFDIIKKFNEQGYFSYSYNFLLSSEYEKGLAIFSKYPIIKQGNIIFNKNSKNNCVFVDVVARNDTIRIYNLHFSSMRVPKLNKEYLKKYHIYLKDVIRKLKNGAIQHNKEINLLLTHTESCPYKYIICGDFNELPYSYNYLKLRKSFENAFEKAGAGFGFTFNGRLFFLRIDHHFVSPGIRPIIFSVDRNIRQSGHYPIKGIYEIM